ncbi:hypothetical protein [Janibacter sp. LM]|uniref:hypothetical protein n=1 Tax=Janibacter sp. LM TaxID=3144845 RepID=UPI0031F6BAA5
MATLVLGLAACGSGPEAPPTTVTVTASADGAEALDQPEQQQIDAATARRVLPTIKDAPRGFATWTTKLTEGGQTYDPQVCAHITLDGPQERDFRDAHRKVREYSRFTSPRSVTDESVTTIVESYDEPYPLEFFDKAGQYLAECASYTTTPDDGGSSTTRTTRAISTPSVGDRSFAVRLTFGAGGEGISVDRLYVRSGHNLVTVWYIKGGEPYDGAAMTKYAEKTLAELKKTT